MPASSAGETLASVSEKYRKAANNVYPVRYTDVIPNAIYKYGNNTYSYTDIVRETGDGEEGEAEGEEKERRARKKGEGRDGKERKRHNM